MDAQYFLLSLESDDFRIAVPDPNIEAYIKDPPALTMDMATQDDFQLLRIIANLGFRDKESRDRTYFVFHPPARMQVRFTADDLNHAGRRGKPLALGYFYEGTWVRFPPGNVAADPETTDDGWANFLIGEIGDPPIAWGT
jgi:hypothetical protein